MPDEPLKTMLRRKRGKLRQKEIAHLLNMPLRTYQNYEYGITSPNPLAKAELLRRLENL